MDNSFFVSLPLWPFSTAVTVMALGAVTYFWRRQRRNLLQLQQEMTARQQVLELELRQERDRALALQTELKIIEAKLVDSNLQGQNFKQDLERRLLERENDIRVRDQRILELEKRRTEMESIQVNRMEEYNSQVRSLVQAREDMNAEKKKLREEEELRLAEALERKKANWQNHEQQVIDALRILSTRLGLVGYEEDTFPLAKKPDFAIEMGEQLIVFDAKAPADPAAVDYFPEYLRKQAEGMEKYLKQEGVRREGFLVVPTDVIGHLKERLFFEVGGYKIFVVAPESLEAIVRLFMKIEEFEVLETVDPQVQEDLAAYIGRCARVMKRRIQVDQYMSSQLLEVLISGESLPRDILEQAKAKEKGFSINPPRVPRGKQVNVSELVEEQKKLSTTQALLLIEEASQVDQ